jgi:ribosome biogenesis GTPase
MQLEGLIYKSTGSWYVVRDKEGTFWNTRIKGKMKLDEAISSTNPIAVGDDILFEVEDEAVKTGMITEVMPRHNYMVRVSPHNKNQKHIIASNLSLALLIVTINEPRTSTGFIDRFLVTAEAYHIPAIIVVNKTDLLKPKHVEILKQWEDIYVRAGYEIYPVVATQPETLAALVGKIKDKVTLFSGHSGVGKSTLINQLIPDINLRTNQVSGWSGKGQHTTTFAEMFDLVEGGKIIDTPGVKEFGIIDFDKQELSHYFPEMRQRINDCKFNNCLHINEPGCAIIKAVHENVISVDRYISYIGILGSIEEKWS